MLRIQHLRLQTGGQRIPVQQVSRQELQDNRSTQDVTGTPLMYAAGYVAGEVSVDFFPALGVNDIVKMSYLAHPGTLTSATTAITYMPEIFQHDILTNAAIAALLERDGKTDEAQTWNARSLEAMTRLEEYLGQMGGNANRAYVSPAGTLGRYPDTRLR